MSGKRGWFVILVITDFRTEVIVISETPYNVRNETLFIFKVSFENKDSSLRLM